MYLFFINFTILSLLSFIYFEEKNGLFGVDLASAEDDRTTIRLLTEINQAINVNRTGMVCSYYYNLLSTYNDISLYLINVVTLIILEVPTHPIALLIYSEIALLFRYHVLYLDENFSLEFYKTVLDMFFLHQNN